MMKEYVEWKDVEKYLKQFVGNVYTIEETEDMIYIGKEVIVIVDYFEFLTSG